jgi:membrane protein implicated in regulation of membrane protease activity
MFGNEAINSVDDGNGLIMIMITCIAAIVASLISVFLSYKVNKMIFYVSSIISISIIWRVTTTIMNQ